jgi:hypothetical protein
MGSQAGSVARMALIHASQLIDPQRLSRDASSIRHRADVGAVQSTVDLVVFKIAHHQGLIG